MSEINSTNNASYYLQLSQPTNDFLHSGKLTINRTKVTVTFEYTTNTTGNDNGPILNDGSKSLSDRSVENATNQIEFNNVKQYLQNLKISDIKESNNNNQYVLTFDIKNTGLYSDFQSTLDNYNALKALGFSHNQLVNAGFTAAILHGWGMTIPQLQEDQFTLAELKQ